MKAEKNTISGAEALKKLKEIIKRIEDEKAELKKELEKVEFELKARASGTTKTSGFSVQDVLANDNNEMTEKLQNKAKKLKNALDKPNYVDEDFRKYSIIYLKDVLKEYQEEIENVKKEIAKLQNERNNIPRKILRLEKNKNSIVDIFAKKMTDIGLSSETECIGLYGAEFIISRYENKCNEYR